VGRNDGTWNLYRNQYLDRRGRRYERSGATFRAPLRSGKKYKKYNCPNDVTTVYGCGGTDRLSGRHGLYRITLDVFYPTAIIHIPLTIELMTELTIDVSAGLEQQRFRRF
jgi:hypothetical protein